MVPAVSQMNADMTSSAGARTAGVSRIEGFKSPAHSTALSSDCKFLVDVLDKDTRSSFGHDSPEGADRIMVDLRSVEGLLVPVAAWMLGSPRGAWPYLAWARVSKQTSISGSIST